MRTRADFYLGLVLVGTLSTSGCSLYHVYDAGGNRLKGIPVSAKKSRLVQRTTWIEPRYVVRVLETSEDGKTKLERWRREVFRKCWSDFASSGLSPFITKLKNAATWSEVEKLLAAESTFTDRECTQVESALDTTGNLLLESNVLEVVTSADPFSTYYVNVDRPAIGNSEAKIELDADGTLKSAEAKVEDKTFETFLGLMPIKEKLAERWLDPPMAAAGVDAVKGKVLLEVVVETRMTRHVLSAPAGNSDLECPAPLPLDLLKGGKLLPGVEYRRIEGAPPSPPDAKPAYRISGEIVKPE